MDDITAALNMARKHRYFGGVLEEKKTDGMHQPNGGRQLPNLPKIHGPTGAPPERHMAERSIVPHAPKPPAIKLHTGPIHSPVAGRTDHLPVHVASGSYVVPADIISGMGEGNSMAGFKVAKSIFTAPFRGAGSPYGATGLPYGASNPPGGHKKRADGGNVEEDQKYQENAVPVVVAGGEYVIHPEDVAYLGDGNIDDGHKIMDQFVNQYRAKIVNTLQNLPGPRKD